MSTNGEHAAREPIAVVGLAFQFPGGASTEKDFWEMMMQRECVAGPFPAERGNIDACYDPTLKGISKVSCNSH